MTIYVLRSGHLVKIGYSSRLRARLSSFRSMMPTKIEFVGHMPGDMAVEQHLHNKFAASHFSGEWFVETEEMRRTFATILDSKLPPLAPKKDKRKDPTDKPALSEALRLRMAERWPHLTVQKRMDAAAAELGWNRSRLKDFVYADPRVAVRAAEKAEIEAWLALLIAPEIRERSE